MKDLQKHCYRTCDLAAMYEPFDKYGISKGSSVTDTPTSNLGSSITACKKEAEPEPQAGTSSQVPCGQASEAQTRVICPNRPKESLEYWLHNTKILSKTGLAEDKLDSNCTHICFVNLGGVNEGLGHEALQKKQVGLSPDIQRLIHSVRSEELKEDEIVLLSGLADRKCGALPDTSQILCTDQVCLLQREKTSEKITSSDITLELNKYLMGLELAQENHMQADLSPLQAEDDTNCSVSSIEEDFLTASEHLEEDSEEEKCKGEPPDEIRIVKRKGTENPQKKNCGKISLRREQNHGKISEIRRPSLVDPSVDGISGRRCVSEINIKQPGDLDTKKCDVYSTESFDDPATPGQYATNLAECVLQDAFIRLSQSENSFTKQAAVSISAGDTLLSGVICKEDFPTASRSWNELPKIVIVQSPDSCDGPGEWVDDGQWSEQENMTNVCDHWTDQDGSSDSTQNTLEVALACAASVISTISNPPSSEQSRVNKFENKHLQEREIVGFPNVVVGKDYSLPSALCGLTRVASAVAVCGLGDQRQDSYPTTSSGLLAAADTSTAVALHCSIALGTSMETFKDNIAKVLLKEAALMLTSPSTYKNVGEFIESMNNKILNSISNSKYVQVGDVVNDDLAHNLSDTILRYSAEKAIQRLQGTEKRKPSTTSSDFVTSTTELLYNVMHFTCKKMNDLVQTGDLPLNSEAKHSKSAGPEKTHNQQDDELPKIQRPSVPTYDTKPPQIHCNSLDQKLEPVLHKLSQNETAEGSKVCTNDGAHSPAKTSCTKQCLKRERYRRHHDDYKAFLASDSIFSDDECKYCTDMQGPLDGTIKSGSQENVSNDVTVTKDFIMSSPLGSGYTLHTPHSLLPVKHPVNNYCITDFADDLSETVVSMATEIAAICLENSSGKQPWFCAWANGGECLLPPCRSVKRKKETPSGGAVVRRHRPPRLSEIKKKTDEHPELKERLMNRVVDESINLEDQCQDPVNAFANEVASKIMNLTESSVTDALWQNKDTSRNRLQCERWSRGKASSCESIPEEDQDAKNLVNTLGPGNTLGQPFSRTSSVSKQSSCESITDEFSRFMVNQMENEGIEFELLLDYYAGKHASNILNSAFQQLSRRNSHLSVRTACLSKQSSTESITEEFYRYMLKEIDKETKDNYSSRKTAEWTSNLLPPSPRTPFCFRQSSMPCNTLSSARLTVNAPVKANSLDGFARSSSRDFLSIQPVNAISSTNLCKSDSCLYQRCQIDQATDMLIHETWSSSIEELMRKNKIIADRTESIDESAPAQVDNYANRSTLDIGHNGKPQDFTTESTIKGSFSKCVLLNQCIFKEEKDCKLTSNSSCTHEQGSLVTTMEVPLIQIEAEQRDETNEEGQESSQSEDTWNQDEANMSCGISRKCQSKRVQSCVTVPKTRPHLKQPTPPSSSEDSTGSWSNLVNEEEIPEDASSYLQLSEQSTSNGNSTTSSVSAVDLDALLEVVLPDTNPEMKPEKKPVIKDLQENPDECTSGLSVGTASCHQEVTVWNIDLDSDSSDSELHTTLQWIAASELGIPTIYFRNSQERIEKFLEVTRLLQSKSWKVGDIFSALILHHKMTEQRDGGGPSFFEWLLELG